MQYFIYTDGEADAISGVGKYIIKYIRIKHRASQILGVGSDLGAGIPPCNTVVHTYFVVMTKLI